MKLTILGVNYNVIFVNHRFYGSDLQGYINRSNEINIEKLENLLDSIKNISSMAALGLRVNVSQPLENNPFFKGKRVFSPPDINITFAEPNKGEKVYILDRFTEDNNEFCRMTNKDKDFISEKVLADLKNQNLDFVSIIQELKMDMLLSIRESLLNYLEKEERRVGELPCHEWQGFFFQRLSILNLQKRRFGKLLPY